MTRTPFSVRAILFDDIGWLILLRRTRPGQPPYWVTPGGGVETTDQDPVSALRRELLEELGATADIRERVLVIGPSPGGVPVESSFYLARLTSLEPDQRTGEEFLDPTRGSYVVERVALHGDALGELDLRPEALKRFVLDHAEELLAAARI